MDGWMDEWMDEWMNDEYAENKIRKKRKNTQNAETTISGNNYYVASLMVTYLYITLDRHIHILLNE